MMKTVYVGAFLLVASVAQAQHSHGAPTANDSSRMVSSADEAMSGPLTDNARRHLEMSPARLATSADSAKAREVVKELRLALAKYGDTTAAVADGYRMFMPKVKEQHVFHFTN